MGSFKAGFYRQIRMLRGMNSPVKLRHVWIPLSFLLVCLYRNQAIAQLSVPEIAAGLGITFFSFLPLFLWASNSNEREPPAFQCFCLIFFPYYAYPILCSKPAYMKFSEEDRLTASTSVLIFLVVAIVVYYVGRSRTRPRGPSGLLAYRRLPQSTERSLCTVMLGAWFAYVFLRNFGFLNLGNAGNVVHTMATGCATVAMWTLGRQIGERRLTMFHVVLVIGLSLLGMLISVATGSLAAAFSLLMIGVVAYSLGCNSIPWTAILISLSLFSFLNLGKSEMRIIHWRHGPPLLSISKMTDIYGTWFEASSDILLGRKEVLKWDENRSVLDRMNLIHMQTLVVHKTPSQLQFLWGKTYQDIPIALIPRLLWPNKPHSHTSTATLGLYYGITNIRQLKTTTIGFGMVAEAWANFGWAGVVGLSVVMAIAMRVVAIACSHAHPSSLHMLLSVVWVGWSFQIEGCMSFWLASLAQSIGVMLVILYPFTYSVKKPDLTGPAGFPQSAPSGSRFAT
jgi:hypothetical protein